MKTLTIRAVIVMAFLCVLSAIPSFAQDKIITKKAETIEAIISEVNISDIKYRKFSNPDGPLYTILKSDIASIIYANGNVEVFETEATTRRQAPQQGFTGISEGDVTVGVIGAGGCYFNPDSPLPIVRTADGYMYNGMSVDYSTVQHIINTVNPLRGRQLQSAKNLRNTGEALFYSGLTLMSCGSIFVACAGNNESLVDTGAAIMIAGTLVAFPVGIPIWAVGAGRVRGAISAYNNDLETYASNKPKTELRLIQGKYGIGIALAF